jgi:hypothetical protein
MSDSETKPDTPIDPFRVTITPAVGPNADGLDHMARAAHGYVDPDAPEVQPEQPSVTIPAADTKEG